MSTVVNVPYRLEFTVEVPGTPEQVWQAIATARGMSAWFTPTELEEREGGSLRFSMGPEMGSDGHVTNWDPPRRLVYEEDWAALMGKDPDTLSPRTSEFVVEAQSGGTCVVRVTSSGFGTGADWESQWWDTLARRAGTSGRRLPTLTIDTQIGFRSAADRAAFADDLTAAVLDLAARYHHDDGRPHRLVVAAHPVPEEIP